MNKYKLKTTSGAELYASAENMSQAVSVCSEEGRVIVSCEQVNEGLVPAVEPKKLIAYIAGPMTGVKDFNRDKFNLAADELRKQGYEVRNPACLDQDWSKYEDYIEVSKAMLRQCDCVFLLPGWRESKGAAGEVAEAKLIGIDVSPIHIAHLQPEWL